jgi:maltooligosyltrehalose trehalohydrolase
MLFQGDEFSAASPFLYFADHAPDLAGRVAEGRRAFLSQFPSVRSAATAGRLAPPHAPETFERSRLDHDERERHATAVALHRSLLRLRHSGCGLSGGSREALDGAVLSDCAFVLRAAGVPGTVDAADRLLVVNLGPEFDMAIAPEPLLAPPEGRSSWRTIWSTDDVAFGGPGVVEPEGPEGWRLPAESAYLLA